MTRFRTKYDVVPLATFLIISLVLPSSFSIVLLDWTILLKNSSPNVNLVSHCYANGNDVGLTTLLPSQTQTFTCSVILKHRSVATCELTLGNLHGSFDLFDWDRDRDRYEELGNYSVWQADEKGLSLSLHGKYVFQFPW